MHSLFYDNPSLPFLCHMMEHHVLQLSEGMIEILGNRKGGQTNTIHIFLLYFWVKLHKKSVTNPVGVQCHKGPPTNKSSQTLHHFLSYLVSHCFPILQLPFLMKIRIHLLIRRFQQSLSLQLYK